MIKLDRPNDPTKISALTKATLVQKYKDTGVSVWRRMAVQRPLAKMSHYKCAFCELRVAEKARYLEVEHFRCKKDFPNEVMDWSNLLPICTRCNKMKSDYNVVTQVQLIEPTQLDPRNHLYYANYRLRFKDEIGKTTISVLYLNDPEHLVGARIAIGEALYNQFEAISERLDALDPAGLDFSRRAAVIHGTFSRILKEGQPSSEFGGLAASIICSDPGFLAVKRAAELKGIWDEELEAMWEHASRIAL